MCETFIYVYKIYNKSKYFKFVLNLQYDKIIIDYYLIKIFKIDEIFG